MKLDKDTVVKHQFWFLLGGYLLFWVIAVFWLKVAAGGPIDKAKKDYDSNKSALGTASQRPINANTFIPPWREYGKEFDKHKRVIWEQAWDIQLGMYDWPFENKDMSTPQVEISQDESEEYKRKLYPNEIKNLKDLTPRLLGPVELEGGFDKLFKPQEFAETPTREEMWLTQEDFWVKRELLYVIGGSVAYQAYMPPDEKAIDETKEPAPEGVLERLRFRNQNWELTLHIKQNKDNLPVIAATSTIKNIQASRQPQSLTSAKGAGIVFNVIQTDHKPAAFEVSGEAVPYGKPQMFSKSDYKPLDPIIDWLKVKDQPIYLVQAFDWPTCPVRRIEAMEVAKQSSRTHTMGLYPNATLADLDKVEGGDDANKQPTGGNPRGGPGGMNMGGGMGGNPRGPGGAGGGAGGAGPGMPPAAGATLPGGAAAASPTNVTPNNGIDRDRYLQPPKGKGETEKPSRHLPIALQVIVDQAHSHDLLVALANSRLRIQITQVDLQRLHGGLKGPDDKNQLRTGGFFMGGMGAPFGGNPRMRPQGGSGRGPRGTPGMVPPGMAPPSPDGRRRGPAGMPTMPPGGRGGYAPPSINRPPGAPMGPMGVSDTKKPDGGQDEENLVELTVYGVATLYRKPDPPKDEQQPGQTAGQTGATIPPPPGTTATPPAPAANTPATTTPPAATTTPDKKDDKKPDDKKPDDKKDDKKPDEKKDDKAPPDKKDDKKPDEKKTDGKAPAEKKS